MCNSGILTKINALLSANFTFYRSENTPRLKHISNKNTL